MQARFIFSRVGSQEPRLQVRRYSYVCGQITTLRQRRQPR